MFVRRRAELGAEHLNPGCTAHPAAPQAALPPAVSAASGPHWQLVRQAILETLRPPQGLHVAPALLCGMTDSRHYAALAPGRVYRFAPQRMTGADLRSVHGVDERIAGGWGEGLWGGRWVR